MLSHQESLQSPKLNKLAGGQVAFSADKYAEQFLEALHESDVEGRFQREQLKASFDTYKDNVQYANNHFGSDSDVKHIIFKAKKSFFNHKFNTQELLRSQHLYKLMHELKYTPDKNLKSYPDVLEDGFKEVLMVNDKDFEIRDALMKWYQHRYDMITFVRKELQRNYFQLFSCEIDGYSDEANNISVKLQKCDEALAEVEDIIRNLKSEQFFSSQRQYEKQHLPELSVVCGGNVVIEKTFAKALKNFPYLNQSHIKRYFNDYVNQHYCSRKVKKVRLINDFLPLKVQLLHTLKSARIAQQQSNKTQFNYEAEETQRELNKLYGVRRNYFIANDKLSIEKNVSEAALLFGINEDVNVDYGCLLLFAIDQKFESIVKHQSESFLTFHPYDLKSPFVTPSQGKKFAEKASDLMKTIEKEPAELEGIKVRSCKTWIDKLQILSETDSEQREQNAVLSLYEDTLINGWLKYLLYTDDAMISQKLQKDISMLKDRVIGLNKRQFEEIYYQFYSRYLKLLFMKSRKSLSQLISYMNYFRCVQKNLNLAYVELLIGQSIESTLSSSATQNTQTNNSSNFDATLPLYQQQEKISAKMHDDKFFLTNPSVATFGNITQFRSQNGKVPLSSEDYVKIDGKAVISKDKTKGSNARTSAKKSKDDQTTQPKRDSVPKNSNESQNKKSTSTQSLGEPESLYEEETISMEDNIITIRDHNDMKIIFDAAIHDFHVILGKIAEICSFYFHFRIKHDMSAKEKDKGLFKDNYDREALIDSVLSLEAQYYLNKVKLLQNLNELLKNTYYPDLRNQLAKIIANIMARRPRVNLFENDIFQCYHFEIQTLQNFNEIISELLTDLNTEEDKLAIIKNNLYFESGDKLTEFYATLKVPVMGRKFNYFMSGMAKLVVNIESSREQFAKLIPSGFNDPTYNINEVLKCENEYFKLLLESTKKIVHDSDGSNLSVDFQEFRFLEKEAILDRAENFDMIENAVQTYVEDRLTKAERDKLNFDAFSMLEFMKVRRKLNNFLFGLSNLLETYKLQVNRISEDFAAKFESNIDVTAIVSDKQRRNYLKLLLDLDAVKIAKEILAVDNWVVLMTKPVGLVNMTQTLYSLILCSQLTQNYVAINNIYFQAVLNDMPKEYNKKLKQSGPEFFRNIFDKKKQVSAETVQFIRTQELNREKAGKVKREQAEGGKNYTVLVFCKRLKREVQFEAMKIQTLLQRNSIEKFSKKLPFEETIFKFTQMAPCKEIIDQKSSLSSDVQIEEQLDSKGEVFFDSLGCAVKIFRMPSVEQILSMTHDDFEGVMERYGMNKVKENGDEDEEEYETDEGKKMEKSQASGGKDWLKAQESKLDKDISLIQPNKNIQVNKGSATLKGFRKREFLEHSHLLYLRKTQLFVLWKILGNVVNILSLCTFEHSIQADMMDMLFFSHGQLGFEKCRINVTGDDQQQPSIPGSLSGLPDQQNSKTTVTDPVTNNLNSKGKSLKELTQANKKAIPVFKRNELRLRRDMEILKTQLETIEKSIQVIRNNPKIADSNEAIMGYLEKYQNRHFLSVLLMLISQLNISRDKNDFEFMFRLRQMIIELNFPQIANLAQYQDGQILIADNHNIEDTSADFTQSPDLKIYNSSSPLMNFIRIIFWDTRPKVEENLHSTVSTLNPCRYYFSQFMRFSSILDKGLIGMAQSRVIELSVTKGAQDLVVANFLRNNFVFELEDPIKYERICTKIINIQVRYFIFRELYLSRKLNMLPFEALPGNQDPLKEIFRLSKEKVESKRSKNDTQKTQQSVTEVSIKGTPQSQQEIPSTPAEEEIMLSLSIGAFSVQTLMYEEAINFYYQENQLMSKWITVSRQKQLSDAGGLSQMGFQSNSIAKYDPAGLNKAFATGSLEVLDTLSILQNFTTKVFFDSTEVKSLNKSEALVIAKEDLTKHLHAINLDLIDLIDLKYARATHAIQQKCDILQKDVMYQKKWNRLLQRKVEFLESNMQNIVESQVASRSNDLIQEIQHLQKKADYTANMRQIDQAKIQKEIAKNFADKLRENVLVNENTLSRFYDFRKGEKLEVFNMVEGIKDHNFKLLKEHISKALEDHGGSSQALHVIDGIWQSTLQQRQEEQEKTKKPTQQVQFQQQPQQQLQQQSLQMSQQSNQQVTQTSQASGEEQFTQKIIGNDIGDLLPADVFERIEVQNKEVYKLLSAFKLLRAFQNMKTACLIEKYEKEIQRINENNSSNEQLYRDKKEMQSQTDSMKEQVLTLKKTMAIMEYQNEILRRDVQRSRQERMKTMKESKNKDDKIKELEEKIEQNNKDRIATYNGSMNTIPRKSTKYITKGGAYSSQNTVVSSQNVQETSFAANPIKTQTSVFNNNIRNGQRPMSSSRPVINTSPSTFNIPLHNDMLARRSTTTLALSQSVQMLPPKQYQNFNMDISQQQLDAQQQKYQMQIQTSLQDSLLVPNSSKQKRQHLANLISQHAPTSITSPSGKLKSSNSKSSLTMTYKIKTPTTTSVPLSQIP